MVSCYIYAQGSFSFSPALFGSWIECFRSVTLPDSIVVSHSCTRPH